MTPETPSLTPAQNLYSFSWAWMKLRFIKDSADKARREYSSKGHYCDFRKALDSIHDLASTEESHVLEVGKQYREKLTADLFALETRALSAESDNAQLRSVLERCREALDWIFQEAVPIDSDWGHKGIADKARAASQEAAAILSKP